MRCLWEYWAARDFRRLWSGPVSTAEFSNHEHLHNGVEEKWREANILRHQPLGRKGELERVSKQKEAPVSIVST